MSAMPSDDAVVEIAVDAKVSVGSDPHARWRTPYWLEVARVKQSLLDAVPELHAVLSSPVDSVKILMGAGFAPDRTVSKEERKSADAFADIVGVAGASLIAELIAEYWLAWPWFITDAVSTQLPDLYEELESAFRKGHIGGSSVAYNAIMHSATHAQVLHWGGWRAPEPVRCRVCGRFFPPEHSHVEAVRAGLGYDYCQVCASRTIEFQQTGVCLPVSAAELTDDVLAHRLQRIADVLGYIPAQDFRTTLQLRGLDMDVRDKLVCSLMVCPPTGAYLERLGRPWTRVLVATGIVDEFRITARGAMSIARDGHACRSIGERIIDDFFDSHGIAHEVEPPWPAHPQFNPRGRMRADWLVNGATYVEYAGLTGDPTYARRLEGKLALAKSLDLPLIVVLPMHLNDLGRVFATFIRSPES